MTEKEKIEQSITALESQRAILGDMVVETALAPLQDKLKTFAQPAAQQQRKYVTVLFADVSGFTAMSETMDAEDVSETMNALWQRIDEAIITHRGVIDKHIGDAVMALFGVNEAREDDPEQAVRAALAMQTAIASFTDETDTSNRLKMRIGINTGPVLLGEVGTTGEFTAMGDTVNVASRLEHAAPIGGVLISHATYRHIQGVFDVKAQNPIFVKGKLEPIQTYVVHRLKPRAFRLSRRGIEGIDTPMVGRDKELGVLQNGCSTVISDKILQMVTINGEAGLGKSRLLLEFNKWLEIQPESIRVFKGRGSEQTRALPYFLIRDLFAFRFQIMENDSASVVRQKMEDGFAQFMGDGHQEKAHVVGHLIGYPFSDSPHLQGILDDPKQIRDTARYYLTRFFKAACGDMPLHILLEDIHWVDDDSLDIIRMLAHDCHALPILIICLTRPALFENHPDWRDCPTNLNPNQYHHINLVPLTRQDSQQLVTDILKNVRNLPTDLQELIVNRAEGNPFYVEELIKMLIEEGVIIKDGDQWQISTDQLTKIKVPATLTGVLQARLDSLSAPERELLKCASVIGRVFWDQALEKLEWPDMAQANPKDILVKLLQREMVFDQDSSSFEGMEEFIFKHAMLRDVTYESVLLRQRRKYHQHIALWMIDHSGERVDEYAGLIAGHLELAQQWLDAVDWMIRAGEQAKATYAPTAAIEYYQKGLDLLASLKKKLSDAEQHSINEKRALFNL